MKKVIFGLLVIGMVTVLLGKDLYSPKGDVVGQTLEGFYDYILVVDDANAPDITPYNTTDSANAIVINTTTPYDDCNHDLLVSNDKFWGLRFNIENNQTLIHREYRCKECEANILINTASSIRRRKND